MIFDNCEQYELRLISLNKNFRFFSHRPVIFNQSLFNLIQLLMLDGLSLNRTFFDTTVAHKAFGVVNTAEIIRISCKESFLLLSALAHHLYFSVL